MKPGSYVTLRNAKVDMFRSSMRLVVNQVRTLVLVSCRSCAPLAVNWVLPQFCC
jgi:hypothetical protein